VADGRSPQPHGGPLGSLGRDHDPALLLQEPYRDRIRNIALAATALTLTFALDGPAA